LSPKGKNWRCSKKEKIKKQTQHCHESTKETEFAKKQNLEKRIQELEVREGKLMNDLRSKAQLEVLAIEDLKKIVSAELCNGMTKPDGEANHPAKRWR
jgi:hypothetical protein